MIDDSSNPAAVRTAAASDFLARGWRVLVLHDVAAGVCSCGNPKGDPKHDTAEGSGGKHPVGREWGAAGISERSVLERALMGRPNANLGILTGIPSGIWVLDIDPRHDGHLRLAELEAVHGRLPATFTVRTGSGGWHLYFTLPDDFTPTTSKGSLPPGIDVRGQTGQVVAPSSVSHAGAYSVLLDTSPVAAPEWLLGLIRTRPPRERQAYEGDTDAGTLLGDSSRLHVYAAKAAAREAQRLGEATPGTRGRTAFEVACNLVELVNSDWSGLDEERVRAVYDAMAERAMDHGGAFNQAEADGAWTSAQRRIGDKGRPVPPHLGGGELVALAGGVPPFPEPVPPASSPSHTPSGMISLPPMPGMPSWSGIAGTGMADPTGATTWASGPEGVPTLDPVDAMLAEFITLDQLAALPPPEPLIEGFLMLDSASWIVGAPGHAKSFVSLDMAMSVATGRPWQGRATVRRKVAYLVAEGAPGMGVRGMAWCKHHGVPPGDIVFIPRPVQASGPEWDVFRRALARYGPGLIVFDTQARISVGMEENSNTEMGLLVEQIEGVRRATGACVLTIHHTTKAGVTGRGAGAILGAAQTELLVSRAGTRVTVKTTKQKDGPELPPVELKLHPVEVKLAAPPVSGFAIQGVGRLESTVVLVPAALTSEDRARVFDDDLTEAQTIVSGLMADIFNTGNGGTKAEVRRQFSVPWAARNPGVSPIATEKSFTRAWNGLLDRGALGRVTGTQGYRWIPVDDRRDTSAPAI